MTLPKPLRDVERDVGGPHSKCWSTLTHTLTQLAQLVLNVAELTSPDVVQMQQARLMVRRSAIARKSQPHQTPSLTEPWSCRGARVHAASSLRSDSVAPSLRETLRRLQCNAVLLRNRSDHQAYFRFFRVAQSAGPTHRPSVPTQAPSSQGASPLANKRNKWGGIDGDPDAGTKPCMFLNFDSIVKRSSAPVKIARVPSSGSLGSAFCQPLNESEV